MEKLSTWIATIFITTLVFAALLALPFVLVLVVIGFIGFIIYAIIHDSKLDKEK